MAQKFIQFDTTQGIFREVEATTASSGSSDAGKIVGLNASGKIDMTMLPAGVGAEARTVVAGENLSAGQLVNIYNDSDTVKARKADASNGRVAHGYVIESVAAGAQVTVYLDGTITGLTGLTPGATYFLSSSTPGGVGQAPPTVSGYYAQAVGYAVSATELVFKPQIPVQVG